MKRYSIVVTAMALLFFVAFSVLFAHAGYVDKVFVKLGIREPADATDWTLVAWENCLEKLDYQADAVFFGDSLTRGSDFGSQFPQKIVNLGLAGDTLRGMLERVSLVAAVEPQKVFVMGGINSLNDGNGESCLETYSKLLASLREQLPSTELYVQSVLPVSFEKEKLDSKTCHNTTIRQFNEDLKRLAGQHNATYIDLYTVFEKDGALNPALSEDGIHISEQGYEAWAESVAPYITE